METAALCVQVIHTPGHQSPAAKGGHILAQLRETKAASHNSWHPKLNIDLRVYLSDMIQESGF